MCVRRGGAVFRSTCSLTGAVLCMFCKPLSPPLLQPCQCARAGERAYAVVCSSVSLACQSECECPHARLRVRLAWKQHGVHTGGKCMGATHGGMIRAAPPVPGRYVFHLSVPPGCKLGVSRGTFGSQSGSLAFCSQRHRCSCPPCRMRAFSLSAPSTQIRRHYCAHECFLL